jgi:hypothetical protein
VPLAAAGEESVPVPLAAAGGESVPVPLAAAGEESVPVPLATEGEESVNAFVRSVASISPSWLRMIRSWSSEGSASRSARISSCSAVSFSGSRSCDGSKRSSK